MSMIVTPDTTRDRSNSRFSIHEAGAAPAFAWLTALAIVATATPVFVRLPFDVPGLQGLTPQKLLLPLVVLTLAKHLSTRRTGGVLTPLVLATGGLFGWLIVSVLVNSRYELTYNVRAWSWLVLDFGLILAVREAGTNPASRRLLFGSIVAAVVIVALLGFVELFSIAALDPLFRLFRPNWLSLGLTGPGPGTVLPLHAYTGGQMRLMSTLSNDTGWVLALGCVVFAGLFVFGDIDRPWSNRIAPACFVAGYAAMVLALLLTVSRSSILAMSGGLVVLLGSAWTIGPHLRRRALIIAVVTAVGVAVYLLGSPVLQDKFSGLASADAWTTYIAPAVPPVEPGAAGEATPLARVEPPVTLVSEDSAADSARGVGAWSVTQRLLMARVALVMVYDNPLFGVGFANFRTRLYEPGRYAAIFAIGDRVLDVQDPHNFFLWICAAGGVPALLFVLLILGLAARTIGRGVATCSQNVGLAITVGATWITFVGFMLMGFTLMTPATQAGFAILVGVTTLIEGDLHTAMAGPRAPGI